MGGQGEGDGCRGLGWRERERADNVRSGMEGKEVSVGSVEYPRVRFIEEESKIVAEFNVRDGFSTQTDTLPTLYTGYTKNV